MVFDWLLKGLSEPTLGTFTINFPQYIHKTNERVKRKLSKPNFPQIPSVFNLESNISPPSSFLELTSFNLNKPLLHNPLSDITKKIAKPLIYSDIYKENDGILSENLVRRADYGVDKSKKLMCEIDIQDEALFRGLGYDTQLRRCIKKEIKRHYRHYIDCELEKSPFMDKETFDEFIIRRGKRFSDENNDFYKVF